MATKYDLPKALWRGDTYSLPLQFTSNGAAMDIQGKTIQFTMKRSRTVADVDADINYTYAIPGVDTDGANGLHTITLQKSETAVLPLATYIYQIKLITPAAPEDIEITYLYGKLVVSDS